MSSTTPAIPRPRAHGLLPSFPALPCALLLMLSRQLLCPALLQGQEEPVRQPPVISVQRERTLELEALESRNLLFRQYCEDVSLSYQQIARGLPAEVYFYRYRARKDDKLLALSARLNLPMETVATANGIASPDTDLAGKELYLPTAPGLFLPEQAGSAYELMLKKSHGLKEGAPRYRLQSRTCVFLQGERFSPTERAFFLDTNMVMPLSKHVLTSSFGYRVSPISGAWKFHSGVDLAAPTGSDVFACKSGRVSQAVSGDPVFGNYIILLHNGGMTSVYAHLSKITVAKGDSVGGGLKIGEVGTTGASTGPHLHFEIRVNGSPTDPGRLLRVD